MRAAVLCCALVAASASASASAGTVAPVAPASGPAAEQQLHVNAAPGGYSLDFVSPSAACYVTFGAANTSTSKWTVLRTRTGRLEPDIGGYLHTLVFPPLRLGGAAMQYAIGTAAEGPFGPGYPLHDYGGSPTLAVMADFGLVNDVSMGALLAASAAGEVDGLILAGDIAYDLHSNQSQVGNDFLNTLQPLVASKPFIVAPGKCVLGVLIVFV